MAHKTIHTVSLKRKRLGKTDYRTRLKILLSGEPKVVIRKGSKTLIVQLVKYDPSGDKVIVATRSTELRKYGWPYNTANTPAAYLTGLLLGRKVVQKGVIKATPDIGLAQSRKGCKLYAAVKGMVDAGMDVPHSKEVLPAEERISGMHIAKYAEQLKKENGYERKFSGYAKGNADPFKIVETFTATKKKIMSEKNGN